MDIEEMGKALEHWLGFQEKIGRSFMMNEDALKYPLADYLVNAGGQHINTSELQYPHPDFPNRSVDLVITDNEKIERNNTEKIVQAFELKLAKSETRYEGERRRIFDDLIRMHMANQHSTEKCYFIIAGKSIHFERDFRMRKVEDKLFYREWFKFFKGGIAEFSVSRKRKELYKSLYTDFVDDYKGGYVGTGRLKLPNKIKTTCEFITAFKPNLVPYMAGIWSVE